MIKIGYNKIPNEYSVFIQRFKQKIQKWLKNGYIGNKDSRINLCDDCKVIFRYLCTRDHLEKFLTSDSTEHPGIIRFVETKYPILSWERTQKGTHKVLYNCLYKAFVDLGYEDKDFPNYELTESLNLKSCPYCNAEEIIYQIVTDDAGKKRKIMDSELDHFYPKSKMPYLAACIHNLVPSGSICNGANGKHNKDTYALNMINPFSLKDSNGIRFRLDTIYAGVLDYNNFNQYCKIYTNAKNVQMIPNMKTFLLEGRYQHELDKAREVWVLYRKVQSKGYESYINEMKLNIGVNITFEECRDIDLEIDSIGYKKKLSKFCVDIWTDLCNTKKFGFLPTI